MQKSIIKDILLGSQKESIPKFNLFQGKMYDVRKRVNAINQRTAQKGVKYTAQYNLSFFSFSKCFR